MVAVAMAAAMVAAARGAAATVWLAETSWGAAFRHGLCCSSYSAACLVRVKAWESGGEG